MIDERTNERRKIGPFTIQYEDKTKLILHRMSPIYANGLILISIALGAAFTFINHETDREGFLSALGAPAYAPLVVTILLVLCMRSSIGFTLEIDADKRTITYQAIKPYGVEQVTRPVSDIVSIQDQKRRLGVYWGGSVRFHDENWTLWGGGIWGWPTSFRRSPEVVRILREYCHLGKD